MTPSNQLNSLAVFMKESSGINSFWDLVDEIVRLEMFSIIKAAQDPDNDPSETEENKKKDIEAALHILKHYSTVYQYEKTLAELGIKK